MLIAARSGTRNFQELIASAQRAAQATADSVLARSRQGGGFNAFVSGPKSPDPSGHTALGEAFRSASAALSASDGASSAAISHLREGIGYLAPVARSGAATADQTFEAGYNASGSLSRALDNLSSEGRRWVGGVALDV